MIGITFIRVAAGLAVGVALLFVSWFRPKKKSWVREWAFPLTGLLGWLLILSGALAMGSTVAAVTFNHIGPSVNLIVRIVVEIVCISGAIYVAVTSTQFIENGARLVQGLPLRKIEWMKKSTRKRKPSGGHRNP